MLIPKQEEFPLHVHEDVGWHPMGVCLMILESHSLNFDNGQLVMMELHEICGSLQPSGSC